MTSQGLAAELAALPDELRQRLTHHGFDEARLIALASTLGGGKPSADRNRVKGAVRAPEPDEILSFPTGAEADACRARGEAALAAGEVAMCVLAGGMATRMGGVVKALVEVSPGRTFLDLRIAENRALSERYGRPFPLWLMTSDATDAPTRAALAERHASSSIATFVQELSLRLTPEGALFRDDAGMPSTYAPGHGDLPDALRRSGLLAKFRAGAGSPNGIVVLANLDNLGATVDPQVLGVFLREREKRGAKVMVEVCDKVAGDKGGAPVHAEGRLQVLEEFRMPEGFDPTSVRVFNSNTFVVDAAALDETRVDWSFFHVEKTAFGRKAVQFERLIQELTKAMPAVYLRVPRDGEASRFLPVKDMPELERRRPEIEAVARSRGFLYASPR